MSIIRLSVFGANAGYFTNTSWNRLTGESSYLAMIADLISLLRTHTFPPAPRAASVKIGPNS